MAELYEIQPHEDVRSKTSTFPQPAGYRLLIALPEMKKKIGSIIVDDSHEAFTREREASNLGFVLLMGPDAYKDTAKFPNGPWCKTGDWVLFRSYAGTKVKIFGKEFRLINDDTVEAIVSNPNGYERAY